jgi:hypothetical protein
MQLEIRYGFYLAVAIQRVNCAIKILSTDWAHRPSVCLVVSGRRG